MASVAAHGEDEWGVGGDSKSRRPTRRGSRGKGSRRRRGARHAARRSSMFAAAGAMTEGGAWFAQAAGAAFAQLGAGNPRQALEELNRGVQVLVACGGDGDMQLQETAMALVAGLSAANCVFDAAVACAARGDLDGAEAQARALQGMSSETFDLMPTVGRVMEVVTSARAATRMHATISGLRRSEAAASRRRFDTAEALKITETVAMSVAADCLGLEEASEDVDDALSTASSSDDSGRSSARSSPVGASDDVDIGHALSGSPDWSPQMPPQVAAAWNEPLPGLDLGAAAFSLVHGV
mmetsp:Transcript_5678/g.20352  ORF Transcript_5678/g.20352 Transcript_5678/m.20352 type:complete len:296 (-) Transcript_5678:139-1026(-)